MQCVCLSEERAPLRLTVVTHLGGNSGLLILNNILKVLEPLCGKLYVASECALQETGGKIEAVCIPVRRERRLLSRAVNCLLREIQLTLHASRIIPQSDVFVVVGAALVLPTILAKLHDKKVLLISIGSPNRSSKELYGNTLLGLGRYLFPTIFGDLEALNYMLADRIVVYSKRIAEENGLKRYSNKLCIAHEHFIDFSSFNLRKKIEDRKNLVGYTGRLSEEKGCLNFVEAIPSLLETRKDITFLIGGDGNLLSKIREYLKKMNLMSNVKMAGWIPHDKLPEYLNELKLLVLPSYTEGLPNIMLEAMACGTPVLATPVGAIPDIIKDGETGFLLKSNDPRHIANKIVELLNQPELLEKVSKNAYKLVRENFSEEKTLESWRRVLHEFETR